MSEERRAMSYEITVTELPALCVAALRKRVEMSSIGPAVRLGLGAIMQAIASSGATISGAPLVIYHDAFDVDSHGDIEICVPVSGPLEPTDGVSVTELPAGPAARTVHRGPYAELPAAYRALVHWIEEHGRETRDGPREVYVNDPAVTPPEDLLTEIQWPLR